MDFPGLRGCALCAKRVPITREELLYGGDRHRAALSVVYGAGVEVGAEGRAAKRAPFTDLLTGK